MIVGIGIDLVDIARIERILERNEIRFINKILTEKEIDQYSLLKGTKKVEYMAGRFAGKEAIAKAFGVGIGSQIGWSDIEILTSKSGAPFIKILKTNFYEDENLGFHISISHTKEFAVVEVIIEQK